MNKDLSINSDKTNAEAQHEAKAQRLAELTAEIDKLEAKILKLQTELEKGIRELETTQDLIQGLIDEYKQLHDKAKDLLKDLIKDTKNFSIDERGSITRIKEKLTNVKKQLVEMKNSVIRLYKKQVEEYNKAINELAPTDEEKSKYALKLMTAPNEVKRFDNDGFYKKLDFSKLKENMEKLSNLRKNLKLAKKLDLSNQTKNTPSPISEEAQELNLSNPEKQNTLPIAEEIDLGKNTPSPKSEESQKLNLSNPEKQNTLPIAEKIELGKKTQSSTQVSTEIINLKKNPVNMEPIEQNEDIDEEKNKKGKLGQKVIKAKDATVKFFKKHRKAILYSAGLAAIAIAIPSLSGIIAPAIVYGNIAFLNKEPKFAPAIEMENKELGKEKVSEEEAISSLTNSSIKTGKVKHLADKIKAYVDKTIKGVEHTDPNSNTVIETTAKNNKHR